MARYIVRRLLWMIPTILIVTFVVYVTCRVGWNPVASYSRANPRATDAMVDEFKAENGLYPGVKGYVRGYFEWLSKFLQGPDSWPKSIEGNGEVWEPLRYSFFNTLRLAFTAVVFGVGIGVAVGILASRKPGGWLDTSVNTTAFFVGGIPSFVSAVILQFVFAVQLAWLPPAGHGVYFVDAATIGDYPKLLPFLVIFTISVIVFNLIAEVLYASLDPRIRLD